MQEENNKEIKCMFPRRIDADLVAQLPIVFYKGEIELVEDDDSAKQAVEEILKESLLGFDTESRPSFRRDQHFPVSILQLSGENKVWIFRLDVLSESLRQIFSILANANIKKVGVAVNLDIFGLRKLSEFEPQNIEDISVMTKDIGIINTGLRNLAGLFCGFRISKSAQMSNWAAETLTEKQIRYAATDAWISRKLYEEVQKIYTSKKYELEPEDLPIPQSKWQKLKDAVKKFFF